jgi:hypothetical protein
MAKYDVNPRAKVKDTGAFRAAAVAAAALSKD